MWRVGLVGTGFWSDKHLQAWNKIENVEIAALCDLNPRRMADKAEQFGVPAAQLYGRLQDMLEHAHIDIVDIVTGPETHLELVKLAASAGKQVMCQKPLAAAMEEAEEIVRVAREAGIRLMVTENWRWLEPVQHIKQILDSGVLGQMNVIRYIHSDYFTARMTPDKALAQPFAARMPRLMFYEMGVHWFDTWRYLFGEPKRLYAETRRFSPYVAGEDAGLITLAYEHYYGFMDMCWVSRRELRQSLDQLENGQPVDAHFIEQFVIDGSLASLLLYADGTIAIVDSEGAKSIVAERTKLDFERSHDLLQAHFIHCLDTGEPFQTSGEDNLKTLKLTFATYESAAGHKVIHFD